MRILLLLLLPISLWAQQDYHVMAYYYPWYDAGHWEEGYWRAELQPAQQPLLGEYDSQDARVIRQHLTWSEEYGIDSWAISWWGRGSYSDRTLRKHILPQMEGRQAQFCIFYESPKMLGGLRAGRIQIDGKQIRQLKRDFRFLAKRVFSHPNYLKVEGKPAVVLYLTRAYRGQYAEGLQAARDAAARHGFELYLIGDEVFWERTNKDRVRQLDAITPYNMHGPAQFAGYPAASGFFKFVEAKYRQMQRIAEEEGVDFIPNVFPGFNDRGVRPEARHYITPPQAMPDAEHLSTFEEYARIARRFAGGPLRMVSITSFNEWHEDTQIEPVAAQATPGKSETDSRYTYPAYGMGYLQLIRQLFAKAPAKP